MASRKRKSGEMSLDKCPITGLPINEKLAKKLKSFDTANKKTIQRVLENDFEWQAPANAGAWSEQDWYNVYAETLLSAQRNATVAAAVPVAASTVASSSSSRASAARNSVAPASSSPPRRAPPKPAPVRAKKEPLPPLPVPEPVLSEPIRPEPSRPMRKSSSRTKPAVVEDDDEEEPVLHGTVPYNPQLSNAVPQKHGGLLSMLFWFLVLCLVIGAAFGALLYFSSSGQKLIAATANSANPSDTLAEKLFPTLLEIASEAHEWFAKLSAPAPKSSPAEKLPSDGLVVTKEDPAPPAEEPVIRTVIVEKDDAAEKAKAEAAAKEAEARKRAEAEAAEKRRLQEQRDREAREAAQRMEEERERAIAEQKQREAAAAAEREKAEAEQQQEAKPAEASSQPAPQAEEAAKAQRIEQQRIEDEEKLVSRAREERQRQAAAAAAAAAKPAGGKQSKLEAMMAQSCDDFSFFDCTGDAQLDYADCEQKRNKCKAQAGEL